MKSDVRGSSGPYQIMIGLRSDVPGVHRTRGGIIVEYTVGGRQGEVLIRQEFKLRVRAGTTRA